MYSWRWRSSQTEASSSAPSSTRNDKDAFLIGVVSVWKNKDDQRRHTDPSGVGVRGEQTAVGRDVW